MDEQEKILNMTKVINDLNKENEELKAQVAELLLKLELTETNYSGSMEKAKKLIETCGDLIVQYNESLAEVHKARDKYKSSTKELAMLKKRYQKEMDDIIKQI